MKREPLLPWAQQEDAITSQVDTETAPLPVGPGAVSGASGSEADAPAWVLGGRYRVRDRIGNGGMAEVFRATDVLLGRDVAVKVFRSVGPTDDAAGATRQELELQALARLSHPNLITLFDASITDTPPYLVMELVEGPNLAARIASGPLPEREVRTIGAQIADALSYVHAHDMVHRDVKPANILLGEDCFTTDDACRARLSDFGIVRLLGSERMTSADFTLGTASYLAPEQARGGDVTPAADVYSLGLVLIEALTGVRSFDGPAVEAVLARLARDPEIPAGLPEPWPQLLRAMTARDPASRPTPAEVSRALRAGLAPAPIPPVAVPVPAFAAAASAPTAAIAAPWSAPSTDWSPVSGPVGPLGLDLTDLVDEPGHPRRWYLLAALFVFVIVGAAGFLAFGSTPSGSHKAPAGPVPATVHRQAPASHASTAAANVAPAAPVAHSAAPTTSAAKHPSPAAPKPAQSASATTSAAPTTSAPAPSTSAAPPTTQAPTTSSAPQSTAAYIAAGSAPAPSPTG